MEYLDRDHPELLGNVERLRAAERLILELGLRVATRLRIEMDAVRLRSLLGDDAFARLLPGFEPTERRQWRYDVHEVELDDARRRLVLELLEPIEVWKDEAPTNYIRSIRLLDASGVTVLRAGDHLTFYLLDLPAVERDELAAGLRRLELDENVLEPATVDPARLEP